MEWNVYYHDFNKNEIEVFNIFNHSCFRYEVKQAAKKYKDKDTFIKQLRTELFYYFCTKCEWEIIISPWVGRKETCEAKVDVYNQVINNWNIFADYVWKNRKELLQSD